MQPIDPHAIMSRLDDLAARLGALHVTALAIVDRLDRYDRERERDAKERPDGG